ncbi:MAG TPA: FecR family protein, partial [Dongiaceae bacterium]|nr:FecR family protein [Dongiaceae bacterium]
MAFEHHRTQHFHAGRKVAALWPVVLVAGAFAAGSPAQSEDGFLNWIVRSVTTDEEGALIEASLSTPQAGATLVQGQRISTGPGQQMVLTNGRDLVTLNPGTSVEIGDNDSTTPRANLELESGTVHVKAGKRTPGHTFSVETAYLVATVKGTQFDVSTSDDTSAVSVTEGIVGVQATATRQGVDVTPGKTAIVDRLTQDLPNLIDSPAGGAASVVDDDSTETASAEDGTDMSGTGDIGSADSAGGSSDGSSGSDSGSSGSDSGSSGGSSG